VQIGNATGFPFPERNRGTVGVLVSRPSGRLRGVTGNSSTRPAP